MDWRGFIQSFFDALHWSWMDGKYERLASFFANQEWMETAEWQRLVSKLGKRAEQEEVIFAVSGQVVPIGWLERETDIQAVFSWKGWRHSRVGEQRKLDENSRLFVIQIKKAGEAWSIEHIYELNEEDEERNTASQETIQPAANVQRKPGYDRERAVAYAHRHWNSANPAYPRFNDDCTNFISQCLHAGGIPMVYANEKTKGWWMRPGKTSVWSYSWSVAHSLYLLLKSGKAPMYAEQKSTVEELQPGDVICYDFDGDGRFQHNTIVVAMDAFNMPLVNARSSNSQLRPWKYEDSTAYTPNIRYAFFHIRGL